VQCNGIYGGHVACFAVSGTNLFAGTYNGGVYLSTNNGTSWTAINNGLNESFVYALAVSGTNIFAGTNGGVFLSTNNGASWTTANNGLTSGYANTFAVSGTNLFAGASGYGVYLSTNNGTSWTLVNNGLINLYINVLTVSGTKLFAGTSSGGVFLSTNNGTSWTAKNNGLTNYQVNALAISGSNLFAGTWGDNGIYLSTNNGTSWTTVNNGLTSSSVNALAVSGINIFAGTYSGTYGGVYLSTNNGTSWTAINNGIANQTILSFAVSGASIFTGTDGGGIYLSTNNGTNWTTVNNGLTSRAVSEFIISGTNLLAGTDGGGIYLSTNNGTSWITVNNGLTDLNVKALVVSGTNLFAGGRGVFLSTNNGTSWTAVNNGLTNINVSSLAVSGTNLFAGTSSGGVFLSTNNGTSWTAKNNGLTNPYINVLAVSEINLFTGNYGGGVFLSTNNGSSWTAVNNGLTNLDVYALVISGTNIFAGTDSSGVFLSTNNGASWTPKNNGLTNPYINVLAVSGTNLFTGTFGNGVYLSTNSGTSWTIINQGFNIIPSVISLLNANNYIFGGTSNNSVWKRPLSDFNSFQAPSNLTYDTINNRLVWTLSPSSNVANYLVYKKGNDNIWKSVADSGGMLNSNQNYYNIQTSGFNYYKVAAISTIGDTAKCDSVYVSRGYVLRRWNTDTIESFKVKRNGFRFGNEESINGEPILWNSSWYSQFYYSYPPYPLSFFFYNSSDYPDWPLFTNVYGRNKCYHYYLKAGNILDSSFIRKSVKKWRDIIYNPVPSRWRGACFGMAASSLLAFYKNASFYNQFPIINNVDNIYDLSPSSGISKIVNWLHQTQYFDGTAGRYCLPVDSAGQTPVIVLNNIESRFSKTISSGKLNEILAIYYEGRGGHAVVPYAIENINDSIKYLYIYDNEHPGNDTAHLTINTISNSCIYNINNCQIKRMFLVGSLESFLGEQTFEKEIQKSYSNKNMLNDSILFFNSIYSSTFYLNTNGDTISGYRITDSSFVGNKNLGFSPMTDGRANPPIYYKIPFTNYLKVILKDFVSSGRTSFLSFDIDSTTSYKIERTDSIQSNQSDIFLIDNGYFSFVNTNPSQKKINMLSIITENLGSKKEKTFDIGNFKMMQYDTVFIKKNNDNLVLKSTGASKIYTLRLNYVDTLGNKTFYNPNIYIAENSTHIIVPIWDSIKTKPVKIFVDIGNNGTIDDTLFISDTATTKITNTNNEIPYKYELYQNYPNPFNPITKIKFDVPKATKVSIRIYDILGREIECLVNEYVQPGKYSYDFNANNLSSGVYFYRLQTGDYTNIKKMVLLK